MSDDFSEGAAYVDGRYMPLSQATIPVTDWGHRRSDVTYDVVSVWRGLLFRLDDLCVSKIMYGRRPRCKMNLTISEAFGCGHVFGL
jgi:hypothetical protein